jgi:hypothetical protein
VSCLTPARLLQFSPHQVAFSSSINHALLMQSQQKVVNQREAEIK